MQFLLWFQKHFNSSAFFERIFKEEIKVFGNTAGFQHVQHLSYRRLFFVWLRTWLEILKQMAVWCSLEDAAVSPQCRTAVSTYRNTRVLPVSSKFILNSESLPWTEDVCGHSKGHLYGISWRFIGCSHVSILFRTYISNYFGFRIDRDGSCVIQGLANVSEKSLCIRHCQLKKDRRRLPLTLASAFGLRGPLR